MLSLESRPSEECISSQCADHQNGMNLIEIWSESLKLNPLILNVLDIFSGNINVFAFPIIYRYLVLAIVIFRVIEIPNLERRKLPHFTCQ